MSTPPATARLRVVQNIAKRPATSTFDEELLLGVDVSIEITQTAYINGGDIEIQAKKKSWVTSDATTALWQIELPVTADMDPPVPFSVREGKDGPIQYFNVLAGSDPMDLYEGLVPRPAAQYPGGVSVGDLTAAVLVETDRAEGVEAGLQTQLNGLPDTYAPINGVPDAYLRGSISNGQVVLGISGPWGINAQGAAYYDPAGAVDGQTAIPVLGLDGSITLVQPLGEVA